jgi:UDP-GlcNAc3NAcA epimerase
LTVIGARPQFIKACPVTQALRLAGVREILVHTGQHYDASMSQVFFDELGLPAPQINLGVGSGTHGRQTAGMLTGLEDAIVAQKPDWVLVYGDTNSTLAGALAAVKLHVPVAHVEAGLRSFNRRMPEEINRVVTDAVATLLFTPTAEADRNLGREGVPPSRVSLVGDVMFDAALMFGTRASLTSDILSRLGVEKGKFVLATIHRAETTDDPDRLACIVDAFRAIGSEHALVWPVHPRTRSALRNGQQLKELSECVSLIDPVGYLDMLQLEKSASVIVTDSGGVQKEAFFFETPCVTARGETEWVELVNLGWNRLCPPVSAAALEAAVLEAIGSRGIPAKPYGDGDAAPRIARRLLQ